MRRSEFSFSDDDLRQAAHTLSRRMMASLPAPEDCHEKPSQTLQRKIDKLIARDLRHATIQRISRRVASILLCVLIGCSTWLALDVEAREAFVQWVREVYENSILYHYFNTPEQENETTTSLPTCTISPLPDECTEITNMGDDYIRMTIYESPDETIMLSYQLATVNTQTEIFNTAAECIRTQVGKFDALFYRFTDPDTHNELIWVDEDNRIAFRLIADLNEDEMIAIAKNVIIAK